MSDTVETGLEPAPAIRVHVAQGLCEGWGECHRRAPDVYPLDDDGFVDVHRFEIDGDHAEAAFWGALACPRQVIQVLGPDLSYWIERRQRRWELASREA